MGVIILLVIIGIYVGVDMFRDYLAEKRERDRRAHKAALRRQFLSRSPDSPAAFELLGDALREADDPQEAMRCYEKALELAANSPPGSATGAGLFAGSGVETKLRLARLEFAETVDPASLGHTMRTRQQICRTCGFLGQAGERDCGQCGAPLPVDTMADAWNHDVMRKSIVSESIQAGIMILIVVVCLFVASWMSIEARGCIGIAAIIVIPIRLLKKIGGS
jgi:hypothetical protein